MLWFSKVKEVHRDPSLGLLLRGVLAAFTSFAGDAKT